MKESGDARASAKPELDWRGLLAAAVLEHDSRRVIGPYTLTISRRSMRAASAEGKLAETGLPNGDRVLTYSPPAAGSSEAIGLNKQGPVRFHR